ncbi:MAG TPA: GAF domain-containing protein, partial [Candidatus Binatia bacterium]|nr:GAF domain-containing protein [Candidatus Binatia bacterium]
LKTFAAQAVIAIENVRLFKELRERNRDLTEALEQQTATSEVLKVISRSAFDLQPVLDTLIENASRLCEADHGSIHKAEGDSFPLVAAYGYSPYPDLLQFIKQNPPRRGRHTVAGRVVLQRQAVHIPDLRADPEYDYGTKFFEPRSVLGVPLLREGVPIGVIIIFRTEVKPFTDKQIQLVTTFADQAVIAIENVRLFQELQGRNAVLREALEQQTATSEILRVIASSPTDVQPVLDVVAENAAKLCEATDASILQIEGDTLRLAASFGPLPAIADRRPLNRETPSGRAILDRQTIHIRDLLEHLDEFPPQARTRGLQGGLRTLLATPLYRERVPIGAILIRRTEVRPFTDKQISLLKTFADQAVIAIENVRLFKELQERNSELREALEHQTATAEVLSIISRSPTDVQPVLNAIVESAARVCGIDDVVLRLREGNAMVPRAHFGPMPIGRVEVSIDALFIRWMREHGTLHVPDVLAQNDFPTMGSVTGSRTFLLAPLRQQGELIGILVARRTEVSPFTPAQIRLLETFADQAVIAIENVRLFQELKESLEQQTATSEILGVIASSPTDIQPVLDVVAENAARLCHATDAVIHRIDGDMLRAVANYGPLPGRRGEGLPLIDRRSIPGRTVIDRRTLHIHDLAAEPEGDLQASFARRLGVRTVLATPLLREGIPIGTIRIRRMEVRPFTDKQIKLLETLASQAVIAIENVRLFNELQERNAELREALEHQTATAEVLGIISRSPTDVQPVLDAIVESAARVCGIDDVVLRLRDGSGFVPRAHFGPMPIYRDEIGMDEPQYRWVREHGTLHIPDVRERNDLQLGVVGGWRTLLSVPLRQQSELVGSLNARRTEVCPFSPAQIKLLETFADQAVIAIENVRLFQELKESLEQQTATGEILGVIASSPTDVQPVFDAIARNAVRLCDSLFANVFRFDGELLHFVATHKYTAEAVELLRDVYPMRPANSQISGRVILSKSVVHMADALSDADYDRRFAVLGGWRRMLGVPMLREGIPLGAIVVAWGDPGPIQKRHEDLLRTFADQAAIAIENVRLFQELQARTRELARSVEELKALGEVGQAVSSTLDLQTVLSTIVRHAVQLSGTDCGIIYEYDEPTQEFHLRASYQMEEELVKAYQATPLRLGQGATGRAAETRIPTQIADLRQEQEFATRGMRPMLSRLGYRSLLAVPLLLDQKIMGALTIYRRETGDFSPEIVNLLRTFATQSVLAIQNARLFREIEEKSRQIEAANRHKSEFLANMSHELR